MCWIEENERGARLVLRFCGRKMRLPDRGLWLSPSSQLRSIPSSSFLSGNNWNRERESNARKKSFLSNFPLLLAFVISCGDNFFQFLWNASNNGNTVTTSLALLIISLSVCVCNRCICLGHMYQHLLVSHMSAVI